MFIRRNLYLLLLILSLTLAIGYMAYSLFVTENLAVKIVIGIGAFFALWFDLIFILALVRSKGR